MYGVNLEYKKHLCNIQFSEDSIVCDSDLSVIFSVQFRANASRSEILIEALSSFKDGQILASCSDNTFRVQFVL